MENTQFNQIELVENHIYQNDVNDIVKILSIDYSKNTMKIFNLTQQSTMWIRIRKNYAKKLIK